MAVFAQDWIAIPLSLPAANLPALLLGLEHYESLRVKMKRIPPSRANAAHKRLPAGSAGLNLDVPLSGVLRTYIQYLPCCVLPC